MSEVARDAKVSKALIFWHFKTKEELFLAVLNRLLEPYFIDFAEEVGALDESAQLRKLVQSYLLFVRDNAPSVRFFLGQLLHGEKVPEELATQVMKLYDGYRELMIDIVRRAQEKSLCSRDIAPEAAAGFMVSALNGSLIGFLFSGGGTADDLDGAVTMLEEWLFRRSRTTLHRGRQGRRLTLLFRNRTQETIKYASAAEADDGPWPLHAPQEARGREVFPAGADAGAAARLQPRLHRMRPDRRIQGHDPRPDAAGGGARRRPTKPTRRSSRSAAANR